jgi:hypothetical protein
MKASTASTMTLIGVWAAGGEPRVQIGRGRRTGHGNSKICRPVAHRPKFEAAAKRLEQLQASTERLKTPNVNDLLKRVRQLSNTLNAKQGYADVIVPPTPTEADPSRHDPGSTRNERPNQRRVSLHEAIRANVRVG